MDRFDIFFLFLLFLLWVIMLLMAFKIRRLQRENSVLKKDIANLLADREDLGLAIDRACKARPELAEYFGGVHYLEGGPPDARHYFIRLPENSGAIIDIVVCGGKVLVMSFRETD